MHFGFALDSWNRDLWDTDLLDTDLDFLVGHGLIQVSQETFYLSPRRLQDVFSVIIFCLPRRLQDVFKMYLQDALKTSWKTKNYYAEDVLKTSARHVLKTSSRLLKDQQMFVGIIHAFFNKIERKTPIHADKSSKYAIKGELTIIFGS